MPIRFEAYQVRRAQSGRALRWLPLHSGQDGSARSRLCVVPPYARSCSHRLGCSSQAVSSLCCHPRTKKTLPLCEILWPYINSSVQSECRLLIGETSYRCVFADMGCTTAVLGRVIWHNTPQYVHTKKKANINKVIGSAQLQIVTYTHATFAI